VAIRILTALVTAVALGGMVSILVPPPRRLRSRLRPYLVPVASPTGSSSGKGPIGVIFGPMVSEFAARLARLIDRSGDEITLLKLRQAGWFRGLPESEMSNAYRVKQLKAVVLAAVIAMGLGQVLSANLGVRLLLLGLGLLVGASRTKGRLDKAIDSRRELMKIEIYTVNQLLAMRVRAGGGVIQAVRGLTQRGHGEVVAELEEALRLHRAGWAGPDAFRRIAELTPEPFCSRSYRLLATAEERGADLASALLALSEDVRETRRESIKRTATKRRAAMLVPTIAILAPVLILFVAAPLPYLITAWQ